MPLFQSNKISYIYQLFGLCYFASKGKEIFLKKHRIMKKNFKKINFAVWRRIGNFAFYIHKHD
jgi:hypothetical protein